MFKYEFRADIKTDYSQSIFCVPNLVGDKSQITFLT